MPYKHAVIYYWSGTGNSYRVSRWMGKIAGENGLTTKVVSIDEGRTPEMTDHELVGVVFPTHGFTAPWHILKFVWRLPRTDATHAFCVATRAGLKFGRLFIPGISGTATFITALILHLKGYHVRGTMSVDMPSNWYSLHPIQCPESHGAIAGRAEQKVAGFMERILSNHKVWLTFNNLYEIIFGLLLSLISTGYLFVGRFFLAKLFFANRDCNGCGICSSSCSVNAIKMTGKDNLRPFWKYNCESCMRCAAFCPHNAIEAGHSWGVVLYFISAVPVAAYLFSWLDVYVPGAKGLEGHWAGDILNLIYYYPAIFISYAVFHGLLRIPAINWFFTHTTMTHFWGRYREPGTNLKDIAVKKVRNCRNPEIN
jgi:ferredoxin